MRGTSHDATYWSGKIHTWRQQNKAKGKRQAQAGAVCSRAARGDSKVLYTTASSRERKWSLAAISDLRSVAHPVAAGSARGRPAP